MNSSTTRSAWTLSARIALLLFAVAAGTQHCPAGDLSEEVVSDGGVLIPDSSGRIAELLLFYDPEMSEELDPLYTDLFCRLGPKTKLRVICPRAADGYAFAERWGQAALAQERDVEVVAVGMPVSIWSRDRCIARQSRSLLRRASYFVPADNSAYTGEKHNDRMVHGLLSLAGLLPGMFSSPLHLEGGNVVSNRRHVFVGDNVVDENYDLQRAGTLRTELHRLFGRPYLLVGKGRVPWCHIDMYLTPIDDRTLLIASPSAGNRLLRAAADEGSLQAEALLADVDQTEETISAFDDVAEQMTYRGYDVIRMPALVHRDGDWMVTYNNVLLDQRDKERWAYVPQYNIPQLDDAGLAVYENLGFRTGGVDVSRIYEYGGALRCVANVTERIPASQPIARRVRTGTRAINFVNLSANLLLDATACDEWEARQDFDDDWDGHGNLRWRDESDMPPMDASTVGLLGVRIAPPPTR
ncbi:MAG: hypothetical protein H6817_06610 [Phycisphaerales bacterium]|nr:hypothetical protein [Phycisphaerales bacterium]